MSGNSFDEEYIDPHGECAAEIARLTRELAEAKQRNEELERDALIRDSELVIRRSTTDRLLRTLTNIHATLYPPQMEIEGKYLTFRPENCHDFMQAMSDRIRAIPAEIDAALASLTTAG